MKKTQSTTGVKLSYFDFSGGRGLACRLALYIANIDFVNVRTYLINEKKIQG